MTLVNWAVAVAGVAFAVAGCTSTTVVRDPGTLRVTVMADGGPALPGGGTRQVLMTGATVSVRPAGGGATASALTDKAGVAEFALSGGSYAVSSPTCGSSGTVEVTVTASRSTPLTWVCPVP